MSDDVHTLKVRLRRLEVALAVHSVANAKRGPRSPLHIIAPPGPGMVELVARKLGLDPEVVASDIVAMMGARNGDLATPDASGGHLEADQGIVGMPQRSPTRSSRGPDVQKLT